MPRFRFRPSVLIIALLGLLIVGCGDDENPIAAFEPEVINTADAFQFQITNATDLTTTLSYTWTNSVQQATVNHATSTTAGSASMIILDGDNNEVYSSNLVASMTDATTTGTSGQWTVQVTFTGFAGSANFRIEPL